MTSSTENFNQTQLQIITTALQLLNVRGTDEVADATDYNLGSTLLNMMIKSWNKQDLHLFEKKQAYLFCQLGQNTYTLTDIGDHCTLNYVQTATTAAYAATTASIVVTSATGMTINDNIGIQQTDNSTFWTTVNNIVGTTITLTTGLSIGCNSNAIVYDYTTKIDKPLRIHYAERRDVTNPASPADISMYEASNREYWDMPNKLTLSTPVQWSYLPLQQTGSFYLWPTPNAANLIVMFSYDKMINDLDNPTDIPDLPNEWLEALTFNLAVRMAPAYGKYQEAQMLLPYAMAMLKDNIDYDQEMTSIKFKFDPRGTR